MPYPFPRTPTLREFVEKAKEFGAAHKHTAIIEGPNGPVGFDYLWINDERYVDLPNLPYDEPLAPAMVEHLARRLKLPMGDF